MSDHDDCWHLPHRVSFHSCTESTRSHCPRQGPLVSPFTDEETEAQGSEVGARGRQSAIRALAQLGTLPHTPLRAEEAPLNACLCPTQSGRPRPGPSGRPRVCWLVVWLKGSCTPTTRSKDTGTCSGHSRRETSCTKSSRRGHDTACEALCPRRQKPTPPNKGQLRLRSRVRPPQTFLPPSPRPSPRLPALCPGCCADPGGPDPEASPQRSQLRSNITAQDPEVSGRNAGIGPKPAQMSPTAASGPSQAVSHAVRRPSPPRSQRLPVPSLSLDPSGTGCSPPPHRTPSRCFRVWQFFLSLNPNLPPITDMPRNAHRCPLQATPSSHVSPPPLLLGHQLRDPKGKYVGLQNRQPSKGAGGGAGEGEGR